MRRSVPPKPGASVSASEAGRGPWWLEIEFKGGDTNLEGSLALRTLQVGGPVWCDREWKDHGEAGQTQASGPQGQAVDILGFVGWACSATAAQPSCCTCERMDVAVFQ